MMPAVLQLGRCPMRVAQAVEKPVTHSPKVLELVQVTYDRLTGLDTSLK
jgi:hypothetical protein